MKIVFIHKKNQKEFSGSYFANNYYKFFYEALPKICKNYTIVTNDENLGQFDVLINYCVNNIYKNFKGLKICVDQDPWDINERWRKNYLDYGYSFVFGDMAPSVFKYNKNITYINILTGIDKKTFYASPWNKRKAKPIFCSGTTGGHATYYLRRKIAKICYTYYDRTIKNYPDVLNKFRAHVSAMTLKTATKYFESFMCGNLNFVESHKQNDFKYFRYIDGVNCIEINESNYKQKFDEYLQNINDPKWEQIALAGREYTLANYENEIQAKKLVAEIRKLL